MKAPFSLDCSVSDPSQFTIIKRTRKFAYCSLFHTPQTQFYLFAKSQNLKVVEESRIHWKMEILKIG